MTDEPSAPARPHIPESMRAAVLFGPGDIRVVDRPVPRPAPDEVLVRVAMCGMCGTDLKIFGGHFPQTPPFGDYTPGHEWTGTVAATGSHVDEFAPGDRVCIEAHRGCGRCDNCLIGKYTACLNYGDRAKGHRATGMTADGGFAEYAVHHVGSLYRLPPSLSFEDAVLISTAGTGLYGLDVAGGYVAGLDVAVFGPGPVGLTTVQVLKALGANQVILVGTRPSRLELGRRLGADHVVNARETDPVQAVLGLTGGAGADMTIECSGGLGAPQQCAQATKRGDRRVLPRRGDDRPVRDRPQRHQHPHLTRRGRQQRQAGGRARRARQDPRRRDGHPPLPAEGHRRGPARGCRARRRSRQGRGPAIEP
jgi:L-iditol 2-dehydrogenase